MLAFALLRQRRWLETDRMPETLCTAGYNVFQMGVQNIRVNSSRSKAILKQTCQCFVHATRYHQDMRYVSMWILRINMEEYPREEVELMEQHEIGDRNPQVKHFLVVAKDKLIALVTPQQRQQLCERKKKRIRQRSVYYIIGHFSFGR